MVKKFSTKIEKGKNYYGVWEDRGYWSLRYKHEEGDAEYKKCTVAVTWQESAELGKAYDDGWDAFRTVAGYLMYKHAGYAE